MLKRTIGIARGVRALARRLLAGSVEPVQMIIVNRRLRVAPIDDSDLAALSNDDLAKFVESEGGRAKELDEKLQKMTAALSVAVTVGGFAGQSILQNLAQSHLKLLISILFLLAMLFLLVGVFIGFDGLRPRPRYGYGASYMRSLSQGEAPARRAMVDAALGFQRDNSIRANQASAAATSVRNGIVLFVAAIALGMFTEARRQPAIQPPPPAKTRTALPRSVCCRSHPATLDRRCFASSTDTPPAKPDHTVDVSKSEKRA